jgi:hypothetical protein
MGGPQNGVNQLARGGISPSVVPIRFLLSCVVVARQHLVKHHDEENRSAWAPFLSANNLVAERSRSAAGTCLWI